MRLDINTPVREQVMKHLAGGGKLAFDLRGERMGDKCAAYGVLSEFHRFVPEAWGENINVVESLNGKTEFMLGPFIKGVVAREAKALRTVDTMEDGWLDLHTKGLDLQCLWQFNGFLGASGIHNPFESVSDRVDRKDIIISPRFGAPYNQRRNVSPMFVQQLYDTLTKEGFGVRLLLDKSNTAFPEGEVLTMLELIETVRNAELFIGCDSGPSHLAAKFSIPQVAMYWDIFRYSQASFFTSVRIGNWWGLPELNWVCANTLPVSNNLTVIPLGTDGRASIDAIVSWAHTNRGIYK